SSGIGSVAGALNKATLTEGKIKYETIMGAPLVGICGSGVVELTHELLKSGLVDETGLMDEAYFDEGYSLDKTVTGSMVKFTQKDVREIQLAKSAIRAGLEMLILRYGVAYKEIEKIYIAGGFGYYLNIKKAVGIGLLPGQYACKIEAAGNSALAGAKCVLTDEAALKEGEQLAAKAEEIQLAADKEFNELYMKNMYFE
ncbi:ASKHA domain-containing protein, partial [Muricomes intestini]